MQSKEATCLVVHLKQCLFVYFRAPRFKGFQQQDSQELLRHLLDGIKAEEVKVSNHVPPNSH